jgi:glycosyltransferase involved in cell wall biosynthesis
MRVLFIAGWYPNRSQPKLGNFIQRHAAAVAGLHEVTVLHAAPDPGLSKLQRESRTGQGVQEHVIYYPSGGALRSGQRAAWRALVAEHAAGADIVHAHVLHATALPLWMLRNVAGGRPVITEHWTGWLDGRARRLPLPQRWLLRRVAARTARFCPVSDDLGRAMQQAGLNGRYTTVQNVVDTTLFRPRPRHTADGRFRLLHVSSLSDEQKNVTGMLRAFHAAWSQEPRLTLEIISENDGSATMAYASGLELPREAVCFTGMSPEAHVAERMAMSDALLLFSRQENMPCVVAEALACGLPVLATDVGGLSEHVGPGHGLLVRSGDEAALAAAMLRLARTPGLHDAESLHGYAVEHFSVERVARAFDEVYRQTLAGR